MSENVGLEEFKSVCKQSFQYLIDDYGFKELPLPDEKYINEFQVRYGREGLMLVILGEGYGTVADISFHFKDKGKFSYQQFLPGFRSKNQKLSQAEQIQVAAEQIKTNLEDVLRGERTELSNKLNEGKNIPPSGLA